MTDPTVKTESALRRVIGHLKPIAEIEAEHAASMLPRTLGPLTLTLLGVGVILGGGIFVLVGTVASRAAGPATSLSFLIAACGCGLVALCYAELAAMIPTPGGGYTYTYASFGEAPAWAIGWNLTLEYVFGASFVAVGWSGYLSGLLQSLGVTIPPAIGASPLDFVDGRIVATGALVNVPAMAITVVIAAVVVRGITLSAMVNAAIVMVKLGALVLFVIVGALYVDASNWQPFIPPNTGEFGEFGASGVLRGTAIVFVAYLGFDAIATTARECRQPQRDLPIGIFSSLAICGLFYAAVALVVTGLTSYANLDVANPLSVALRAVGGKLDWLAPIIEIAALAGLAAVMLGILLAQPRVLMAMSRDGLLPGAMGSLHYRYRTPALATTVTAGAVCILAGLLPIGLLSQLVSMGALWVFVAVCAGVLILRYRHPDQRRPFKAPAVAFVAPAGCLFCLFMLTGIPAESWILYAIWLTLGALFYVFVGRKSAVRVRAAATAPKLDELQPAPSTATNSLRLNY